jgi:hypothetical protein
VNKTFVRDAPGVLRWHHGGRRKGFGPVGQGLKGGGKQGRPKRKPVALGTKNAQPLIIRIDNGAAAPNAATEGMRITAPAAQVRSVSRNICD